MATNKKLSAISWYERTHSNCTPTFSVPHTDHVMLTSENVLDKNLGRVVRKTTLKSVDNRKKLATYKVTDFSLENLVSIGADISRSVYMRLNSLDISDSILSSINSKS